MRPSEAHARWVCDERCGLVAVYPSPKRNCLDGLVGDAVYVRHGSWRRGTRLPGHWVLPRRYAWAARVVAVVLNTVERLT
jgi:hypothetical protein